MTMRNLTFTLPLLALVGVVAPASPALADDDPLAIQTEAPPYPYSGRTFGVGAVVGDPTALTLKLRFDDNNALQLGMGWGFIEPYGDRFMFMLDYLVHFTVLYPETKNAGLLQPYVGIGGKLGFRESPNAVAFGARVPLGLAFQVRPVPLELFLEVAPGILVYPAVRGTVDGGIGARFYF